MHYTMFMVNDKPYCVWEWDLKKKNLDFIQSIDLAFFDYLTRRYINDIDGNDSKQAAMALRASYIHGIETLFTLMLAAAQSPHGVPAWIQKCGNHVLREMVEGLNKGYLPVWNAFGLDALTWENLSERINQFHYPDNPNRAKNTQALFARAWGRFGDEFVRKHTVNEYNSIKHGFRAKSGGFGIAMGVEKVPGVPADEKDMHMLGGSDFGSSFFVAEPILDKEKSERQTEGDPNFRIRKHSVNWRPESMIHGLQLIAVSINNIVSFLQIVNDVPRSKVPFKRPEDDSFFDSPWWEGVGVAHAAFDTVISRDNIKPYTKDEIRKHLEEIRMEFASRRSAETNDDIP